MYARTTVFSEPKLGNAESEWEDKAAYRDSGNGYLRFLVLDGASEGFDTIRWVEQLASSYMGNSGPPLDGEEMCRWFAAMQQEWAAEKPHFTRLAEERRYHEVGSMATMLVGAVKGLGGPGPCWWYASALGDTVLFHVRGGRRLQTFPLSRPEQFGTSPPGIATKASRLQAMASSMIFANAEIKVGDTLFVATDALADWMLREALQSPQHEETLFTVLNGLYHPSRFRELMADQRESGAMTNDDVTLLRIRFSRAAPTHLVVCL